MAKDKGDYEVGYGKPPKATRFKKGQSGNPKGRPKGAKNLHTSIQAELGTKITVREGGKDRTITKRDAMAKQIVAKGLKGDAAAIRTVLVIESAEQVDECEASSLGRREPTQTDRDMLQHFMEQVRAGYELDGSGGATPVAEDEARPRVAGEEQQAAGDEE